MMSAATKQKKKMEHAPSNPSLSSSVISIAIGVHGRASIWIRHLRREPGQGDLSLTFTRRR